MTNTPTFQGGHAPTRVSLAAPCVSAPRFSSRTAHPGNLVWFTAPPAGVGVFRSTRSSLSSSVRPQVLKRLVLPVEDLCEGRKLKF